MLLYPMAIMTNPAPRSLADAPEIPSIVFITQILVTWNTTTALGLFMNLAGLSSNSPPRIPDTQEHRIKSTLH